MQRFFDWCLFGGDVSSTSETELIANDAQSNGCCCRRRIKEYKDKNSIIVQTVSDSAYSQQDGSFFDRNLKLNASPVSLKLNEAALDQLVRNSASARPYTPRQHKICHQIDALLSDQFEDLKDSADMILELEALSSDDDKYYRLRTIIQEFMIEMNRGCQLVQMTASFDYVRMDCSVDDDFETLTLDPQSGRLIEFPLDDLQQILQKSVPRGVLPEGSQRMDFLAKDKVGDSETSDHLVILEFSSRKLIFVFGSINEAQRFELCMKIISKKKEDAMWPLSPLCTPRTLKSFFY